jgi:hypothetical protein
MNSNGDSPTPEEDNRVSVLLSPPRLGTPLTKTPCSAALSHDLKVVQKSFHDNSDVRRFMRIKPIPRERHWRQLPQAHVNNGTFPKVLGLDALFYRFASEISYCQRLSNIVPPDVPAALSTDLQCLSPPWVLGHLPENLPFASRQRHSYPTTGYLPDPESFSCARDSAYAMWAGTTRWGTGDPGRLLQFYKRSARNTESQRTTSYLFHCRITSFTRCQRRYAASSTSLHQNGGSPTAGPRLTCSYLSPLS